MFAGELTYNSPDNGEVGYKVYIVPNQYFVITVRVRRPLLPRRGGGRVLERAPRWRREHDTAPPARHRRDAAITC